MPEDTELDEMLGDDTPEQEPERKDVKVRWMSMIRGEYRGKPHYRDDRFMCDPEDAERMEAEGLVIRED